MNALLVRDVMTIGVPVCRESETCGKVADRLEGQASPAQVIVALDENGMACGWIKREQLDQAAAEQSIGDVMEESIPTIPADIPVQAAAQIMHDRGVEYLFLMHDWPGQRRPAAFVSRASLGRYAIDAQRVA